MSRIAEAERVAGTDRAGSDARAIREVLAFWLEEVGPPRWFATDPALDRLCAERVGAWMEEALAGRLSRWNASPEGALAHLILLDQIPRNVFRGTARAHAGDIRARAVAHGALVRGFDRATPEPARQIFYLPFMHSEVVADQALSVALFATRMPETGADNLDHAIRHRDVIRRFGRFPSRNAALGRADRAAETAWREAGGYMG
jgi:uncharacterized protein (DUF924 family)